MKLHSCWVEDQSVAFINERLESLDIAGTNSLYPDELSGGMRKRVGLLRATMLQPKLILLDEPTAGLDPANIARFTRIVEMIKVTRGISAIFVTHDLTSAFAISDRVALLHNGILRAVGTPQEMKNSTDPIVKDFLFPQYRWKAQASQ
jgi:phospholipid/cholesterol/gamma-HCH transport system ATP-binding protein